MILKMLNPRNLKKEIDLYGYHFSWKTYVMAILATVLGAIILGKLLYLEYQYIAVIAAFSIMCIPFFIYYLYKSMYEQKRFSDAGSYIENVMYAFMKRGLILPALEDVEKTFEKGMMKDCLNKAITFIRDGRYEKDLYQEAFAFIEKEYANERVANVNHFMLNASKNGGDIRRPAEIFVEDKVEWEYNVGVLQRTKKEILKSIYATSIMIIVFCYAFLYLENEVADIISVANNTIVQVASTALILGEIIVVLFANKKMATNWLEYNFEVDSKAAVKEYLYLKNYDVHKEQRESIIFAAPFFIGAMVLVVLKKFEWAAIVGVIGVLMLSQHKLNYKLSYDKLTKFVKIAFPQWVTNMTLLLQTNNVSRAIAESIHTAPEIMKHELRRLLDEISANPESVESYQKFFDFLDMEEIKRTMQILYSVSETGNAEIEIQLNNLQSTNMRLKNVSEKLKNEEIIADMEFEKTAPVLLCCMVQFVYLAVFMYVGMPALNNMVR